MDLNNICIHGTLEWKENKTDKVSLEYFEGSYPQVYCNLKGDVCSFKDYQDCLLWEKKEKE